MFGDLQVQFAVRLGTLEMRLARLYLQQVVETVDRLAEFIVTLFSRRKSNS
jgi:hypothetical protein